MILDNMRFKNYTWECNPEQISMSSTRNIKEITLPFAGTIFQDYGREKRIVSGKGDFFGDNCLNQFKELFKIYSAGKEGLLYVPGMVPFNAVFKNLEITCSTVPNLISYEFEFWENFNVAANLTKEKAKYHISKIGESIYYISEMYDIPVETILKLNPAIKNLNSLDVGRRVILK